MNKLEFKDYNNKVLEVLKKRLDSQTTEHAETLNKENNIYYKSVNVQTLIDAIIIVLYIAATLLVGLSALSILVGFSIALVTIALTNGVIGKIEKRIRKKTKLLEKIREQNKEIDNLYKEISFRTVLNKICNSEKLNKIDELKIKNYDLSLDIETSQFLEQYKKEKREQEQLETKDLQQEVIQSILSNKEKDNYKEFLIQLKELLQEKQPESKRINLRK